MSLPGFPKRFHEFKTIVNRCALLTLLLAQEEVSQWRMRRNARSAAFKVNPLKGYSVEPFIPPLMAQSACKESTDRALSRESISWQVLNAGFLCAKMRIAVVFTSSSSKLRRVSNGD